MTAFSLQSNDSPEESQQDSYMSVQAAAEFSGYSLQYLRRLVNGGAIDGTRIGQVWLVNVASLKAYLKDVRKTQDRRYGPRIYHRYSESETVE